MMLRRFLLVVFFAIGFLPAVSPSHAQTTTTIFTVSGRLSIQIPELWVSREMPDEEEIEGLDSETLVFGTSHDVIDQYLALEGFDGTVFFLSAYPYSVYEPEVLGDPLKMMTDVTVYQEADITVETLANFPAATYLYDDPNFFIWELLLDTGDLTYRGIVYSTRKDDFELVQQVVNSVQTFPVNLEDALVSEETRTLSTRDERLSFSVPANWLFWNETDNTLTFATGGKGYEGVSYSFKPAENDEIVFVVHRMVKSGLRGDEIVNGAADLPRIAGRLVAENDGLRKDTPLIVSDWQGVKRLDSNWLVKGTSGSVLTQTALLEMPDVVYFVQAQYAADKRTQLQSAVDSIFDSMTYIASENFLDSTQIGLTPGMVAPEFSLPLLDGGEATLSDYRGKVVLMNMWASWCGPCHREAPDMQTYYDSYAGQFEILAVNIGETEVEAGGFVNEYALTFPVLLDSNEQVAQLYELRGYPTTYIIGRDGVVLDVVVGSFSEQGLKDTLALYVGR